MTRTTAWIAGQYDIKSEVLVLFPLVRMTVKYCQGCVRLQENLKSAGKSSLVAQMPVHALIIDTVGIAVFRCSTMVVSSNFIPEQLQRQGSARFHKS